MFSLHFFFVSLYLIYNIFLFSLDSFCQYHYWAYNTLRPNPKYNSIFSPYYNPKYASNKKKLNKKQNASLNDLNTTAAEKKKKLVKRKKKKPSLPIKSSMNISSTVNQTPNGITNRSDSTDNNVQERFTNLFNASLLSQSNDDDAKLMTNGKEEKIVDNRELLLQSVEEVYQDCKAAIETDYELEDDDDDEDDDYEEDEDELEPIYDTYQDVAAEEYENAENATNHPAVVSLDDLELIKE